MTFKERMKGFVMSSFIGRQLVKLWVYREHNVDVHLESEQKGATKQYYDLDENEIEEIINNSDEVRLITPMPENIADNWEMQDDLTDEEEAIMIASMQNNKLEDDIPDQVLRGESVDEDDELEFEDGWYPDEGNKRPHIGAIKEWIKNVKWSNMNDYDLFVEYRERFGLEPQKRQKISYKQKESLLDSTAFLIARKQWYLGRKPSSMTDFDWDERKRDKRPTAGSFSKNDYMFKAYDRGYEYKSGDRDILEEKLKEGQSLRW